ncbi:MAG: helix-turn-helix domain-containing protein [Pseudomonadota bacterium]|nr:helix-turn-helix domain-containing protein [Pseudomonadota bacterium]
MPFESPANDDGFVEVFMTPKEVADLLHIKPATLAVWRCTGCVKLPYTKVGSKVRYRRSVVERHIDRNTHGDDTR